MFELFILHFFCLKMWQINKIALKYDACPMDLVLLASSTRHIKISASMHWFCLISIAKANRQLLTYKHQTQLKVCSINVTNQYHAYLFMYLSQTSTRENFEKGTGDNINNFHDIN